MSRIPTYDVVIVGAGLAGCAVAISLKQLDVNLSILILERKAANSFSPKQNSSQFRIGETVPSQIELLLLHLKLLKAFKDQGYKRSFGTSAAWGSASLDQNEFIYATTGYGYVVDRVGFDLLMQEQALEAGIEIRFETSLYQSTYNKPNWRLQTINSDSFEHQMIKANFVVDASGRKAAFATLAGSKKVQEDQLVSLYTHIDKPHNHKKAGTLIESTSYGWWYSNFLSDGSCILALMTDTDLVKEQRLKLSENFYALLENTKHTRLRLPGKIPNNKLNLVAAHTQCLDKSSGDAWVAIGDAASCYDPLSSLGMYKSLQTAIYGSYACFDWLNGNEQGVIKYDQLIKNAMKAYREKKQHYYRLEQRFAKESFWQRRKLIA